jgi:xanthine dehydrogenase accessory factor
METVFREAQNLLKKGEPFAIATVVDTKGSTPQKPGAKLLVRQDGSGVGTLGGGCVEGDIWFAAKMLMKEGGDPVIMDYLLNEDIAAQEGLVCGGTMYFLVDPVVSPEPLLSPMSEIVAAYDGGPSVGLATLLKPSKGKGRVGDKLFIKGDGQVVGSLGDPQREEEAITALRELIDYGKVKYLNTKDGSRVFLEGYTTPPAVVIAGGGHIGKSLAPLVKFLGLRLAVIDDRKEFANKERFPEADQVVVAGYAEGVKQMDIRPNTAVVVCTRGHQEDDSTLEAAALSPAGYVGLVGSKRKAILIYEELLAHGVPLERLKAIHSPIGLDIGALTPEEIALSVMAQIVAFRAGRSGGSMTLDGKHFRKIVSKVAVPS